MGSDGRTAESAWTPLSHPVFRALWIASLVSNIGTWMQNVSAAWAMTSLSPSPLMVALVQSATSLPVFLVGLPAGAVADIVDRRRLLLVTQCWMLVAAGLLAVLTFVGLMTATTLLALTFALGVGVAMNAPTWQAITSELVPPSELTRAVTLNALPVNIGRAVGPALGGVLVAASGPALVFALNAVSFVAVLVVVYRWRRCVDRDDGRSQWIRSDRCPRVGAGPRARHLSLGVPGWAWPRQRIVGFRRRARRSVDRARVVRRWRAPGACCHPAMAVTGGDHARSHAVGALARASPRCRPGP